MDAATGDVMLAETDVTLPGVLPLVLERTCRSSRRTGRWFGAGWLSSFDQRLQVSADRKLRRAGVDVPTGWHGDHLIDLQLGGKDTLSNLWPLDGSVNSNLGSQIAAQIRNLPVGTKIRSVRMS